MTNFLLPVTFPQQIDLHGASARLPCSLRYT